MLTGTAVMTVLFRCLIL